MGYYPGSAHPVRGSIITEMSNTTRIVVTGMCLMAFFVLLVAPVITKAQAPPIPTGLKKGIDIAQQTAEKAGLLSDETTTAKDIVVKVINFVLSFVGLLAVLFLIIAGVMYITSLGDEGKAEKAKKMILYIIIGILLILLAAVIVNVVLDFGHPADLPPGE